MSLSAVGHVRRALSARQYDGQDPVDLSNDYEIDEGAELPAGMMQPDAPLVFWTGYGDTEFDAEAQRRYIATTSVNVVITAALAGEERAAAVAGRVEQWFVGAIAGVEVGPAGIIQISPAVLALNPASKVDRAGRAVLSAVVTVEHEVEF